MSATVGTRNASPGVDHSSGAGWKTFFIWVGLSLLAFPIAGELAHIIAGPIDGVAPALIGGALTGAGIGFAQWLMLRGSLGVGLDWIVVTAVGLAVGLAVGAVAVGYETDVADLAIMGAISGAFLGIGQGVLLRGRFSLWIAWMVVMPVLWSAAWVVSSAVIGNNVDKQFIVFGASGAIVFGCLSGLLLVAGMRQSEKKASE